jgi:glutamate synthase (NADPH/NADH) large chain
LLAEQGQTEEATSLDKLLVDLENHFLQIIPVKEQADPSVSTE